MSSAEPNADYLPIDEMEDPNDVERAWADEIHRRIGDLRSGKVEGIPLDQAIERLKNWQPKAK